MNRVNGIRFNGLHSYYDFGMWLSERPDWGDPEPKLNLVEIPGADGMLDLTEANSGEVKFSNRMATLTFAAMVKADRQETFKARIRNALHGKVCTIIPDEAPEWYYRGRCTVSFMDQMSWKLRIMVTVDADPYAMKNDETVVFLVNGDSGETVRVERSTNTAVSIAPSSVFPFGEMGFPTGVMFAGSPDLIITWDEGAQVPALGALNVYVYDSDGNTYIKNITSDVPVISSGGSKYTASSGEINISMAELIEDDLDPEKAYRVRIDVAGCRIYTESALRHFRAWNERKSAVPVFDLQSIGYVTVTVNGQDFIVHPGKTQNEEIVLVQGWNDLYVLEDEYEENPEANIQAFSMIYREGRL